MSKVPSHIRRKGREAIKSLNDMYKKNYDVYGNNCNKKEMIRISTEEIQKLSELVSLDKLYKKDNSYYGNNFYINNDLRRTDFYKNCSVIVLKKLIKLNFINKEDINFRNLYDLFNGRSNFKYGKVISDIISIICIVNLYNNIDKIINNITSIGIKTGFILNINNEKNIYRRDLSCNYDYSYNTWFYKNENKIKDLVISFRVNSMFDVLKFLTSNFKTNI